MKMAHKYPGTVLLKHTDLTAFRKVRPGRKENHNRGAALLVCCSAEESCTSSLRLLEMYYRNGAILSMLRKNRKGKCEQKRRRIQKKI